MDDVTISVTDLSFAYRLAHNRVGSLKEFAIRAVKRQVSYEQLWALNDVSFEVRRGEVFGVVGPNGAGKSTLMKLLARVLPPTRGRVVVRGRLAPMIELGAGFNGEMTAFENIVLYGTLLGRTPALMRERARPIAEWAELTDFLDVPVRSYSTGMLARLGFAVATDTDPEVLVVDEVLSVGDESFQRRSRKRIESMINAGTSVVIVSHDLDTIQAVASSAMWLEKGHVKEVGPPADVIAAYRGTVLS